MLRSMTAYGRGTAQGAMGTVRVELSSVNGKHLEVQISAPPELVSLEVDVRRTISSHLSRGRVRAMISYDMGEAASGAVSLHAGLLKQLHHGWCEAAGILGAPVEAAADLSLYASRTDLFGTDQLTTESLGQLKSLLQDATDEACRTMIEMREVEGAHLFQDLSARCDTVRGHLALITEHAPEAVAQYRSKLQERLAAFEQSLDNRDVLAREVALFADKVDITEELTRAQSHVQQLMTIMNSADKAVGKKMDFLLQELAREANTTLAKSSQPQVSQWAVEIKTEVEKMREQVQNVE